ncbi:hypothetical protein LIA77_02739 [Sarocladium implicatum]|nr:hypothetical protein LIA77_02739 [Sarocladium implicatum]
MPRLAPVSEVSSDATRSEASNASIESRKDAMRRLRFGPRIGAKIAPRSVIISKEAASKPTPASPIIATDSQQTPYTIGADEVRIDRSASVASNGDALDDPDASVSSLELDSFPIPPFNSRLTLPTEDVQTSAVAIESFPTEKTPNHAPCNTTCQEASLYSPDVACLSQRLPAPSKSRPSPSLHALADGAASVASGRPVSSVDSALIEAISRSVAEHLRMLSITAPSDRHSPRTPSTGMSISISNDSRTSSQREALKRFAKDLMKYAEQTNAKGKVLHLTPSSRSPATLHTVSALMPYRREFKAAGLAVTSRDQARLPTASDKQHHSRNSRQNAIVPSDQPGRMSQVDGNDDRLCSRSSKNWSSEISFIAPGDVDEWRYALVEEVSRPKSKARKTKVQKGKGICFPCFSLTGTTRESVLENVKKSIPKGVSERAPTAPLTTVVRSKTDRPSHIPLPIPGLDSAEPSPRHLCDGVGSMGHLKSPARVTGYRRPSMTVPRAQGHLESCSGGHTYAHPDEEIHKHNPRPTTTQYLHPSTAIRPQTSTCQLLAVPPDPFALGPSRSGPRMKTGVSLPNFPFSRNEERNRPLPLRRTVGHLPDRPRVENRVLTVRNPTEPVVEPDVASATEKLYPKPLEPVKKRGSLPRRPMSRRSVTRRIRPAIPMRASSILHSMRSTEVDQPKRRVADRNVLRGLHVATSAACDEEVDDYVREKTGLRIRQFLADLVALETYWSEVQSNSDDGEQRARNRRRRMRQLKQHMRRSRAAEAGRD